MRQPTAAPVEKPARQSPPSGSRRGFLRRVWWVLGGLFVAEWGWVMIEFLRPRKSRGAHDAATTVIAGPVERFDRNTVTAFPQGRFYLARLDNGGFLAMCRECTHLGCTVPWDAKQNQFVCPCHASAFDITGNVVSRPAPRALDLFAVRIENGIVKVDTSRRIRRQAFEARQVTRS